MLAFFEFQYFYRSPKLPLPPDTQITIDNPYHPAVQVVCSSFLRPFLRLPAVLVTGTSHFEPRPHAFWAPRSKRRPRVGGTQPVGRCAASDAVADPEVRSTTVLGGGNNAWFGQVGSCPGDPSCELFTAPGAIAAPFAARAGLALRFAMETGSESSTRWRFPSNASWLPTSSDGHRYCVH